MSYNVSQANPTNFQAAFNDAIDISQGMSVLQLCGGVTYASISDTPDSGVTSLNASELTLSLSGMISIVTSSNLTVGKHTITMNVFLSSFANITRTQSLSLKIYPCYITGFKANSLESQIYTINDPIHTWSVSVVNMATQTPSCGYSQTAEQVSSTLPAFTTAFLTASSINLISQTSQIQLAGKYSIQFDVSLAQYPYSPVPITTASQSLTLLDPCRTTKITGPMQIQNFVTQAGHNQTSSLIYAFNDSLSLSSTLQGDSYDFCGEKIFSFQINSASSTDLSLISTQQILFSPKENATVFGTLPAQMQICMKRYPTICKKIDFNVTTLSQYSGSSSDTQFKESGEAHVPQLVQNFTKDTKRPTAYIRKVDQNGLLIIQFDQSMNVPKNFNHMQNMSVQINDTSWPILQLKIQPGRFSDPSLLRFNWTLKNFTATQLQIQLKFNNPDRVSYYSEDRDRITAKIYGTHFFLDEKGVQMYSETMLKQVQLHYLPQITSSSKIERMQQIQQLVTQSVVSVLTANIIISSLVAGSIQTILDSIKKFQILAHQILINVAYPVVCTFYFGFLMQIFTFQFYDFFRFFNRILWLDDAGNNEYTMLFGQLGYSSFYLIQNFGTLCWTVFIVPFMFITTTILAHLIKRLIFLSNYYYRKMFFDFQLKFAQENYLFLGVCVALNFNYFYFNSIGNQINSILSIILAVGLVLFPFVLYAFYNVRANLKKIISRDKEFLLRYCSVLEGLNFDKVDKYVLIYPFIEIIRKLSLILTVILMQNSSYASLYVINTQSLVMISFILVLQPYESQLSNQVELFNEIMILLSNYHYYAYTGLVSDAQTREIVGISQIVIVSITVVANLGTVSFSNVSLICKKIKLKILRRKHRQQVLDNKKAKTSVLGKSIPQSDGIEIQIQQQDQNQLVVESIVSVSESETPVSVNGGAGLLLGEQQQLEFPERSQFRQPVSKPYVPKRKQILIEDLVEERVAQISQLSVDKTFSVNVDKTKIGLQETQQVINGGALKRPNLTQELRDRKPFSIRNKFFGSRLIV